MALSVGDRLGPYEISDFQSVGRSPDGQVMALEFGLRATLWEFQPAQH